MLDALSKITRLDPEARLFPTWSGASGLNKAFRRVLAKARVRPRKLHALRHSFASILLSRNAPLIQVQRMGGWKSAKVLLDTYSHWIEEAAGAVTEADTDKQTSKQNMATTQGRAVAAVPEMELLTR